MANQNLRYLLGLHIPDVNVRVLGARNADDNKPTLSVSVARHTSHLGAHRERLTHNSRSSLPNPKIYYILDWCVPCMFSSTSRGGSPTDERSYPASPRADTFHWD